MITRFNKISIINRKKAPWGNSGMCFSARLGGSAHAGMELRFYPGYALGL
jgi:hypothetical protein